MATPIKHEDNTNKYELIMIPSINVLAHCLIDDLKFPKTMDVSNISCHSVDGFLSVHLPLPLNNKFLAQGNIF